MLPYANTEIDFTVEHLVQIASEALWRTREYMDKEDFEEFLEELDLTEEQREFLIPKDEEEDRNTCKYCPYNYLDDDDVYPSCHYNYDDGDAPCERE